MRHSLAIGVVVLAATVLATGLLPSYASPSEPILGGPSGRNEEGFGRARPSTVFYGGDPTGLIKHIEWLTWGGPRAVGVGVSTYVGPHQFTAQGTPQSAVIVLSHLGSCHGQRAYDATAWYFPEHGQRFQPQHYRNACTGRYHE